MCEHLGVVCVFCCGERYDDTSHLPPQSVGVNGKNKLNNANCNVSSRCLLDKPRAMLRFVVLLIWLVYKNVVLWIVVHVGGISIWLNKYSCVIHGALLREQRPFVMFVVPPTNKSWWWWDVGGGREDCSFRD